MTLEAPHATIVDVMNASQRHLYLILAGAVAAACSSDVSEPPPPTTASSTTGFGPDGGFETEVCFDWPPPQNMGAGGEGGGGGAGGAAPGPDDPCPEGSAALPFVPQDQMVCGGASVRANGPHTADQCCYTLYEECGVGRPFVDAGGGVVTAEARRSRHWTEGAPDVGDVPDEARSRLAERWRRDAFLEHASVASFGRFALELMAVGAPSRLLTAAHEAALDEVRHAERCFDLARAYGLDVDPGPMEMGAVEVSSDLCDIAARTVVEGCIGETLASVLAAEQHRVATVAAVQETLAVIARDEARHAELAWRAVAWMIEHGGAPVRRAVEAAFADALTLPKTETTHEGLEAHGLLSAADERALVGSTLTSVIAPLARQLAA